MENYQAQIVGMNSIPTEHMRGKWNFLDAYAKKLEEGQALRLSIPKGASVSGAIAHWKRISGGRGKNAQKAQQNGSNTVWLWLEGRDNG